MEKVYLRIAAGCTILCIRPLKHMENPFLFGKDEFSGLSAVNTHKINSLA